ncbi:MAG: hypothetical protein HQ553_04440 [Chloroflexi bacterium]|nr:hypothetical protein [Chloroflexota bacterium]
MSYYKIQRLTKSRLEDGRYSVKITVEDYGTWDTWEYENILVEVTDSGHVKVDWSEHRRNGWEYASDALNDDTMSPYVEDHIIAWFEQGLAMESES